MKSNKSKKNKVHTDEEIVELVNTFKSKSKKDAVKEGAKWISTGVFMGSSDAIPGYSGGTTLALLGFFKKLVLVSKSVFVPEPGLTRIKALLFMVPFLCGWIAGVFGFAKITEFMSQHNMGLELVFFFSGFILFAIPVFMRSEKPPLFKVVPKGHELDRRMPRPKMTYKWLIVLIGIVLVLGVAIAVKVWRGGIDLNEASTHIGNAKGNVYNLGLSLNWLKLIGVAFLAGFISLIPGGSGALIQLLTGEYQNIHWKIMAHANQNIGPLFMFAFFTFLGMLSMVFIMAWGLKKHEPNLAALSFGMLIASVAAVLIVPDSKMYAKLADSKHIIGIIVAAVAGIGLASAINLYTSSKIRQKKLRNKKRA